MSLGLLRHHMYLVMDLVGCGVASTMDHASIDSRELPFALEVDLCLTDS